MGKRVRPVAIVRRPPNSVLQREELTSNGTGARPGTIPEGWRLENAGLFSYRLIDPTGAAHRAEFNGKEFVPA